jgi:hypothetical protein
MQIKSFKSPIGTADIPAVDFNPLQVIHCRLSIADYPMQEVDGFQFIACYPWIKTLFKVIKD